jgi:hypothetical protein
MGTQKLNGQLSEIIFPKNHEITMVDEMTASPFNVAISRLNSIFALFPH